MEFKQLKYFVSVAKYGSISAAAEKNYISQPALGLQIKKLEDNLGTSLFNRHARGINLTEKGKFFMDYAQKVLSLIEETETAMKNLNDVISGSLSISVTPTLGRAIVPDLIEKASTLQNKLTLTFGQSFSDEVKEQIDTDQADIGFSYNFIQDDKYASFPLFSEEMYLVGHPIVLDKFGPEISFDVLAELPMLLDKKYHANRKWLEKIAVKQGFNLSAAMEIDAVDIKSEILLKKERCTVAPYGLYLNLIQKGRLSACRIVRPEIIRTMFFVCSREKIKTPSVLWLYETILELIDEKVEEGNLRWKKENYSL